MPCRTNRDSVVPERRGEAERPDEIGDRGLLLLAADVDTHQRLRPLQRGGLGEVHDIDGRSLGVEQVADGLLHRRGRIRIEQRDRPLRIGDQCGGTASAPGEVLAQEGDIAQRRRHQQELCSGQLQQRHLPRPAAVRVAVKMELVHDHQADLGIGTFPQGDVGQHLGGTRDDRRVRVDRGIASQHADIGRPEHLAQSEELLADQCLDRCGVKAAALLLGRSSQRRVQRPGGHQRLARPGRRCQYDVGAADQLDQGLLLGGVQRGAALLCPRGEGAEQPVGVGAGRAEPGQFTRVGEEDGRRRGRRRGHCEHQRARSGRADPRRAVLSRAVRSRYPNCFR